MISFDYSVKSCIELFIKFIKFNESIIGSGNLFLMMSLISRIRSEDKNFKFND